MKELQNALSPTPPEGQKRKKRLFQTKRVAKHTALQLSNKNV